MKKIVGVIYIVIILLVANQMVLFKVQYDNGFDSENHIMCSDEVEEFSDKLCSGKKKDKEKVMAIYGWIKENVCYDYEANPLYQHVDIEKTLQTKKGICYDYACLFAALCHCQGIPCYVLDGYSRENSSDKHTWNRVFYDGCWWNLDVTFDAVQYQSGKQMFYGFQQLGLDCLCDDEDYVITRVY